MTRDIAVAKRYARALFEVAREQGGIERFGEELRGVLAAIESDADFAKVLKHPGIGKEAKRKLLANVFEGRISAPVLNTLYLLIERGREPLLPVVVSDYEKIANEALGQVHAVVLTPFELSEAELAKVAETFGKLTGKKTILAQQIDKSLIGGIQVRIGDRLYDGSVSGQLARLQQTLQQQAM